MKTTSATRTRRRIIISRRQGFSWYKNHTVTPTITLEIAKNRQAIINMTGADRSQMSWHLGMYYRLLHREQQTLQRLPVDWTLSWYNQSYELRQSRPIVLRQSVLHNEKEWKEQQGISTKVESTTVKTLSVKCNQPAWSTGKDLNVPE